MNKVRFVKRGLLYIETYDIDGNVDTVITIKNPFDTVPIEVELVKIKNEYFIKGQEPKRRSMRETLE